MTHELWVLSDAVLTCFNLFRVLNSFCFVRMDEKFTFFKIPFNQPEMPLTILLSIVMGSKGKMVKICAVKLLFAS